MDLVYLAQVCSQADSVADAFSCPICLNLVYQPMQCKGCQKAIVCRPCIKAGNITSCPLCKKMHSLVEPQRIVQNLLNDILVVCQGPKGDGSGCLLNGKPIKYSVLVDEHSATCSKGNIECSLGCGHPVESVQQFEQHLALECPKAILECRTCRKKIVRREIPEHCCEEFLLEQIVQTEMEIESI